MFPIYDGWGQLALNYILGHIICAPHSVYRVGGVPSAQRDGGGVVGAPYAQS